MTVIDRMPGKPMLRVLLLAVYLSVILSGASAQTPASSTPKVAVVSPAVDGQQSSAAPLATGGASTAKATVAPGGATTVPPAASNVTNQPTAGATVKSGACKPNPSPMPGAFVKQCEADGSFSTKQCHGSTGICYCAHPQDGTIYQETGRRGSMEHDCATYWQNSKGPMDSVLDFVKGQNTGAIVVAAIGCILTLGVVIFVVFGEIRGVNMPFVKSSV
ncbi:angiomotin-like isoform X1 [Branchiostoma lanceolatum]|uniref:angiomotin-like isoform X1 n=1 Tax=Branchiostoma lanceolatum TaxID=7740 RepID=UPI003454B1E3